MIPLFHIESKTLKDIQQTVAIKELYYLEYRLPTQEELSKTKFTIDEIKTKISDNCDWIPLYDVVSTNIYIIQKRNVYYHVINNAYRFPDELILEEIEHLKYKRLKKLENNQELNNDKLFIRYIHKLELMEQFMKQLDHKVLNETYLKVFYRYAPEIGNATYTCVRKSFIPHMAHLKPYYTKDEVLKLGMNIGLVELPKDTSYIDFKDTLTNDYYTNICRVIHNNDINASVLLQHQNYIISNNLVGLIQYYTIQGCYFMNQYLRGLNQYEYHNDFLEVNIEKIWSLVLNAPAFDNDYILYRFVNNDDFMKNIQIGEIFQDKGFMSTTRDPYYREDLHKFGFILIKIKIPKEIHGVGLCLETLSRFPTEEEIILPPLTKLRLIAKNNACNYYHPNDTFVSQITTRYEFEWVSNSHVSFIKKPQLLASSLRATKIVDFLSIKKIKTSSIKEKIEHILRTYFDPMNRIICVISDKQFYVIGEWYDSTGPYADMYSLKTTDGFSLYSIYQGYMLFMIEIGEKDNQSQIKVNFFTKHSRINRQEILGDDNFIKYISSIAYYFDVANVTIYADYMSCDTLTITMPINKHQKFLSREIVSHKKLMKTKKIQRTFSNTINSNIKKPNENIDRNNDVSETYTGGSYCVDYYRYYKYGEKRYYDINIAINAELQPLFSYHELDILKTISPKDILIKEDRDEIYQIYIKNYLSDQTKTKDNIADFYIWMIENKCYLMDIFISKINRLYKNRNKDYNPFMKDRYILDAMAYLYNRGYIFTYSRYIKITIEDEQQKLNIPKNDYRIVR